MAGTTAVAVELRPKRYGFRAGFIGIPVAAKPIAIDEPNGKVSAAFWACVE